jgi:hypothetical protein
MALRAAVAAGRQREWLPHLHHLVRSAAASLHTSSATLLAQHESLLEHRELTDGHQRPPAAAPPVTPPAAASSSSALTVRHQPESPFLRAISTAINAIHRYLLGLHNTACAAVTLCLLPCTTAPLPAPAAPNQLGPASQDSRPGRHGSERPFHTPSVSRMVMLVGSLRRLSANEAYVRRYLEARLGFDSFTLEYLLVSRPSLFRLSVARDIEPACSWMRRGTRRCTSTEALTCRCTVCACNCLPDSFNTCMSLHTNVAMTAVLQTCWHSSCTSLRKLVSSTAHNCTHAVHAVQEPGHWW